MSGPLPAVPARGRGPVRGRGRAPPPPGRGAPSPGRGDERRRLPPPPPRPPPPAPGTTSDTSPAGEAPRSSPRPRPPTRGAPETPNTPPRPLPPRSASISMGSDGRPSRAEPTLPPRTKSFAEGSTPPPPPPTSSTHYLDEALAFAKALEDVQRDKEDGAPPSFAKLLLHNFPAVEEFAANGVAQLKELHKYLQKRQNVEADYAKALAKLHDTFAKSKCFDEPIGSTQERPGMNLTWHNLMRELTSTARTRLTLSTDLDTHVVEPVRQRVSELETRWKTLLGRGQSMIKELNTSFKKCAKARIAYDDAVNESFDVQNQIKAGIAKSKDVTKLKERQANVIEKVNSLLINYEEADARSRALQREHYETRMAALLHMFHNYEVGRLSHLDRSLTRFSGLLEEAEEEQQAISKQLTKDLRVDPKIDAEEFVKQRAGTRVVTAMSLLEPTKSGRVMIAKRSHDMSVLSKFVPQIMILKAKERCIYLFEREDSTTLKGTINLTEGPNVIRVCHSSLIEGYPFAFLISGCDEFTYIVCVQEWELEDWARVLRATTMPPDHVMESGPTISVTVKSAKFKSKGEFQCQVGFDGEAVGRTSLSDASSSPQWNDTLTFNNLSPSVLAVFIYVKKGLKDQKTKGTASIPLMDLVDGAETEGEYPVVGSAGEKYGTVVVATKIKLGHTPFCLASARGGETDAPLPFRLLLDSAPNEGRYAGMRNNDDDDDDDDGTAQPEANEYKGNAQTQQQIASFKSMDEAELAAERQNILKEMDVLLKEKKGLDTMVALYTPGTAPYEKAINALDATSKNLKELSVLDNFLSTILNKADEDEGEDEEVLASRRDGADDSYMVPAGFNSSQSLPESAADPPKKKTPPVPPKKPKPPVGSKPLNKPMELSPEEYYVDSDTINFNSEFSMTTDGKKYKTVLAATPGAVLDHLTVSAAPIEPGAWESFLLSYRNHTTGAELLAHLGNRVREEPSAVDGVIAFVTNWVKNFYFVDIAGDRDLHVAMQGFLATLDEVGVSSSVLRKALVDAQATGRVQYVPIPEVSEKVSWKGVSLEMFATQLTLTEFELFRKIEIKEFVGQGWSKENKHERAPNIVQLVEHFNLVAKWVSGEILSQRSLRNRVNTVSFMIHLADALLTLNNFSGVMEVLGGLSMSEIRRLKATWARLSSTDNNLLAELQRVMAAAASFKVLRERMTACANDGVFCVPFLGMYLTDLTFLADGNPNTVENGLSNYRKWFMIGHVYSLIRAHQRCEPPYSIEPHLRQYILDGISRPLDAATATRISRELEPRRK